MKSKSLSIVTTLGILGLLPATIFAQQALKVDTTGNPTTALNLGGNNVTGTLAVERLPVGVGMPIVQVITQTQGSKTLTPGITIALLKTPLTGALNLVLPASNNYPAGRLLVIIDPAGYSNSNHPVSALPVGSDLLNGFTASTGPFLTLSGTGAIAFYPDGVSRWSAGQSHLRAPSANGLTLSGPATSSNGTVLSVRNGTNTELFAATGDGNVNVSYFNVVDLFTSDAEAIYTDGEGTLTVEGLTAMSGIASDWHDFGPNDAGSIGTPDTGVRLYAGTDGKLHALTTDNVDHVLSWVTSP